MQSFVDDNKEVVRFKLPFFIYEKSCKENLKKEYFEIEKSEIKKLFVF